MNDPWDVKSVRQSDQYISCMKFNGVPLLPPVLSKECRKEMQYYKYLAKEVEKRISLLQPCLETDSESEDKTDAPDLSEYDQSYEITKEDVQAGFNINISKITAVTNKNHETIIVKSPKHLSSIGSFDNIAPNLINSAPRTSSPKFVIDVSLSINEINQDVAKTITNNIKQSPSPADLPERDNNCVSKKTQFDITQENMIDTEQVHENIDDIEQIVNYSYNLTDRDNPSSITLVNFSQDGPSSLSTKSFTGSLNDLQSESIKEQVTPKLLRQRSYTLLKPSPQLLAHLEVQSLSTGVEVSSISMSESLSNLSTPNRKRRSWDLETAKVKWSSMALELKQKNFIDVNKNNVKQQLYKKSPQTSPLSRAKSVIPQTRRSIVTPKNLSKSEPGPKSEPLAKRKAHSPVRNMNSRTFVKESNSPKTCQVEPGRNTSPTRPITPVSESEDPATRVRELYEKIQKQQLIQMATLVEKQKREQLLLQQVFEEQNNLLFKQLKTICPKSPIEAKPAWEDKEDEDRGPVSLSQLINYKSPDQSVNNSPVSSTLTDTNQYINHCDKVLKQSRDISGSLKKHQSKSQSMNGTKIQSSNTQPEGSRTRTHSPTQRNTMTPRRLNYDTSASSDREYEPILTDRTNDTMADLNVTFPSDNSDGEYNMPKYNNNIVSQVKPLGNSDHTTSGIHSRSTENSVRYIERQDSIYRPNSGRMKPSVSKPQPTPQEREAATKIVAHVKGYLVRRLMKTDRVQATVQTIKDALLCALQLHQDREGIRGADVDLHRRLIQQITAACYCLHETFIASTTVERCSMIASDRARRRSIAARQTNERRNSFRPTDIMSQSHSGAFPSRAKRPPSSPMTQSNYETFSGEKVSPVSRRYVSSPRRRPWR